MKVLDNFEIHNKNITILKLKSAEYDTFIKKLPDDFLRSYITEEKIREQKSKYNETSDDIYNQYIPDDPKLMSGEFGEILSYGLIKELYERIGLNISGLKKTLHKEAKNVASHGTDIVLFYQKNSATPSDEDILISAEVKAKATKKNDSAILKAVKDAEKDYLNRLAETLIWLKRKYKEIDDISGFNSIQRFCDPLKTITFHKHFKAIAVIDKNFLSSEKRPKTTTIKDDLEIILILIDNLKGTYETVYNDIQKSIENV